MADRVPVARLRVGSVVASPDYSGPVIEIETMSAWPDGSSSSRQVMRIIVNDPDQGPQALFRGPYEHITATLNPAQEQP